LPDRRQPPLAAIMGRPHIDLGDRQQGCPPATFVAGSPRHGLSQMDDLSVALTKAHDALEAASQSTGSAAPQAHTLALAVGDALGRSQGLEQSIDAATKDQVIRHADLLTQAFDDGHVGLGLGHANALLERLDGGQLKKAASTPRYVNTLSGIPLSDMKPPWDT
jgi:hypothetical protein